MLLKGIRTCYRCWWFKNKGRWIKCHWVENYSCRLEKINDVVDKKVFWKDKIQHTKDKRK